LWLGSSDNDREEGEVAGAASLVLAVAAVVYLLVGPIYQTAGSSCTSSGTCVTFSGTEPLGWSSVLLVPMIAAGLVLAGVGLNRWTSLSLPVAGLGCLGLAVITFLGMFSIGLFLLPADLAAGIALFWIRERRRST
jgi:hypothetical protein